MSESPANPNALGFLSLVSDPSGVFGGYLLTNTWGRPLEFRLSSAVQPNRVQHILYGPTLAEYLHADLIGKALVEKSSALPGLLVTDTLPALALWARLGVPAVSVAPPAGPEWLPLSHERCGGPLSYPAAMAGREGELRERLDRIDCSVELAEPFERIREAMAEARKQGVASRVA